MNSKQDYDDLVDHVAVETLAYMEKRIKKNSRKAADCGYNRGFFSDAVTAEVLVRVRELVEENSGNKH